MSANPARPTRTQPHPPSDDQKPTRTLPRPDGGGVAPRMIDGRRNPAATARPSLGPYRPHDRAGSRLLRYQPVLTLTDAGQPLTVDQLAALVDIDPKVVSDLLRAALAHGHVIRPARGVYRAGHLPRSTHSKMRLRLAAARPAAR